MIAFSRRAKYPPREITPRRLAAARRALQREQDKFPLFAHEIAAEQSTPQGRCEMFDRRGEENQRYYRARKAPAWWGIRRVFHSVPNAHVRFILYDRWRRSSFPKEPSYLLYFLRKQVIDKVRFSREYYERWAHEYV